jgi:hypothetical protein
MTLDSGTSAELRRLAERRLSAEDVAARLAVPIDADERQRVLDLVEWFCRRYPTPAERLAYIRRAARRWTATQGVAFP